MLKSTRFGYIVKMSPYRKLTFKRQAAHSGVALALGVVPWSKFGSLINESYIANPNASVVAPLICAIIGGLLWWYVLEQGTLKRITERMQPK